MLHQDLAVPKFWEKVRGEEVSVKEPCAVALLHRRKRRVNFRVHYGINGRSQRQIITSNLYWSLLCWKVHMNLES